MKKRDEILLWQRFKNTRDQERSPSIRQLANELGIDEKRAGYLASKWWRGGLLNYGVSVMAPWLTDKGKRAEIALYGFDIPEADE